MEKALPEITPDFITENKKLDQTRQNSKKKGGPYTSIARKKRRERVFQLHFDYGYSSRKIAKQLNANRHTIDGDINYGYSQLSVEWESYDVESWFMKQTYRLESQRSRLLEELNKQSTLQDKLSLEKMILEIDSRLAHLMIKISSTRDSVLEYAYNQINNWAKDQKIDIQFIRAQDLLKVTEKTGEKIFKLIKEDKKNRIGRW